ncbi:MAG: DUF4080 domain-containing protein [Verrucomicrobiae bacterium]|nr:DUF4080 domain-containing protein [Verrucomicrobiae bacterium]
MPDIVLTTLNAKYIHAAFGLRYLLANLGSLQSQARLMEFDINQRPVDIAEALLAQKPRIIGLGVYIWNVAPATELVALLKRIRPELIIILGGPEVSYEVESQPIVQLADYVITGEADLKFAEVCAALLSPSASFPKIIRADLPDFSQLALPYELYNEQDIAHRVIYVEASRGCPFTCEFCLSSLDIPVRQAPLPSFLEAMQKLLDRGVRQFKFVDRTFNLNVATSRAILEFFLERHRPGNFYHFEMIPDRLPEGLRDIIALFPPGTLQFEVGIQTFNPDVAERIRRRQNYERMEDNFRFLREQTGVHIHADLIAGLPGENLESFAAGFDRLIALRPHEIQVGILKRLRGTPIMRHDAEWEMVYNPHPPYELLRNKSLDFATMQKLRRFARYWDLLGNSGNFVETTPLLWRETTSAEIWAGASPFHACMRWSEWLHARTGRTDGIALVRLMELLFDYLTGELQLQPRLIAETLWRDYQRGGRADKPSFLRGFLHEAEPTRPRRHTASLKRQARHLTAE